MLTRVVNGLLILVGAYVIVVYALLYTLLAPYPLSGLDASPIPRVPQGAPSSYIVGGVTIAIAVVALLVGLFSLLRRADRREASVGLVLVGAYLLVLRILYPPVTPYVALPANAVILGAPEPALAWVSLVVGIVVLLVGMAGFFPGALRGAINRRAGMVARLVNGLLILVGAYVIVVYALWSPYPLGGLVVSPPISEGAPNNYVVGGVTFAVVVVAVLVGLVSVASRSARWEPGVALGLVGAYLLALCIIFAPVDPHPTVATPADIVILYPPEPTIAWVSLVVGIVAVLVGVAGFVAGARSAQPAGEPERAA